MASVGCSRRRRSKAHPPERRGVGASLVDTIQAFVDGPHKVSSPDAYGGRGESCTPSGPGSACTRSRQASAPQPAPPRTSRRFRGSVALVKLEHRQARLKLHSVQSHGALPGLVPSCSGPTGSPRELPQVRCQSGRILPCAASGCCRCSLKRARKMATLVRWRSA